jgi:hypothetical protein
MEDEGCTLWDLNHEEETFCDSLYHAGVRSLQHIREGGNPYNIVTNFEEKIVCPSDTMKYSLCGWIKTQNTRDASIEVQYFESRPYGTATGTENMGVEISGDIDWTFFHHELNVPAGTNYFDIRLNSSAPEQDSGFVWYDDVSLICWEPWGKYDLLDPIPFPNNFYHVQVKSVYETDQIKLTYTESTFEEIIVGVEKEVNQQINYPADNLTISPNPFHANYGNVVFRFNTSQEYDGRISIFDYKGVRIFQDNIIVEQGLNEQQWTGKNNEGKPVSPGIYIVMIKAGNEHFSGKCIVF